MIIPVFLKLSLSVAFVVYVQLQMAKMKKKTKKPYSLGQLLCNIVPRTGKLVEFFVFDNYVYAKQMHWEMLRWKNVI